MLMHRHLQSMTKELVVPFLQHSMLFQLSLGHMHSYCLLPVREVRVPEPSTDTNCHKSSAR